MTRIELIKWIGTFFIILSPIVAYFQYIPENFIVLSIGTCIWLYAGWKCNDKPMMTVNFISTILNIIAYIGN